MPIKIIEIDDTPLPSIVDIDCKLITRLASAHSPPIGNLNENKLNFHKYSANLGLSPNRVRIATPPKLNTAIYSKYAKLFSPNLI
jgi:hypothetical protein